MDNQEIKQLIYDKSLKHGNFILSDGNKSSYLFDIMELIQKEEFIIVFKKFIKHESFLVGIEFGGSILAAMSGKPFALIRKDGTIYGKIPKEYSLIDDVITTEKNMRQALRELTFNNDLYVPRNNIVIVDRRNYNTMFYSSLNPLHLHIESMYKYNQGDMI